MRLETIFRSKSTTSASNGGEELTALPPQPAHLIGLRRLLSLREACHYVKDNNPDPDQLFCFVRRFEWWNGTDWIGVTLVNWPTCQNYSTDTEGNKAKKIYSILLARPVAAP